MLLFICSIANSAPLSSYQEELEERAITHIAKYIEQEQHSDVQNYIQHFQQELFYSSRIYYETALLYNQKNRLQQALTYYENLLRNSPYHKAGLFDRSEIFVLQNQYDLAWKDLQTLEEHHPKHGLWVVSLKQAEVSAYQEHEWNFEKYLMRSLELGMDPYYLTTLGSNWYYWCHHQQLGPSLYAVFSDIELEERILILTKLCQK
jgi:tetratricopeptide (TPR) repeat protein